MELLRSINEAVTQHLQLHVPHHPLIRTTKEGMSVKGWVSDNDDNETDVVIWFEYEPGGTAGRDDRGTEPRLDFNSITDMNGKVIPLNQLDTYDAQMDLLQQLRKH